MPYIPDYLEWWRSSWTSCSLQKRSPPLKSVLNPSVFFCTYWRPSCHISFLLHRPWLHLLLRPLRLQEKNKRNMSGSKRIHGKTIDSVTFFFHSVICNMVFLICQRPWSSVAEAHPQRRGSLTCRGCYCMPYFPDKTTDMLNEVEVKVVFLCCHKNNRQGRWGEQQSVFKHLRCPLRESPSNMAK